MKAPQQMPPEIFHRFFQWYCHPKLVDHIEGDLLEVYGQRLKSFGKRHADIRFMVDVLLLFRPGIIRSAGKFRNANSYTMYKSYFKTGWRNLLRNKGYSTINIGGLAVGIAVVILIGLWINDELTFNTVHKNHHRIAKVYRTANVNGEIFTTPYLPRPLVDELRSKHGSDFKHVINASIPGDEILSVGEKKLSKLGEFVDAGAVEMLSLPMLQGDQSALSDPNSIILSALFAKALFGEEDAINKTVQLRGIRDLKVTGVYQDIPHNSDFRYIEFFAPWELNMILNPGLKEQGFANNFLFVYAEIQPNVSFADVSHRIKDIILNNVKEHKDYVAVKPQLFLHPMERWHLYGTFTNGVDGGLIQYVKLFGITGAFVLLLACINFMNLSTARSEKRAKEVGIRKSIGSLRHQLIGQFFSESFLIVCISFVASIALVGAFINWFNELANKQIQLPWTNVTFWLACAAFILLTSLISGSYPAFYLSSFNAVKILKGTFRAGRLASLPRRVLVVLQFAVSVSMIIGTFVVYKQIQFAKDRPVGYQREGLLMLPMLTSEYYQKYDALKNELKNSGAVTETALSLGPVTDIFSSNGGFSWKGMEPDNQTDFATLWVSAEYGKTVGWHFLNGRDFSSEMASDSLAIVMNKSAAKLMGLEDVVGEDIRWAPTWDKARTFHVIGVIEDMVMRSPFDPIMPTIFFLGQRVSWIDLRINPALSTAEALTTIESVFKKVITSAPFTYKFADEEYALKFAEEERIGKLAAVFAVLAILISCLGLFGLASFVAEQKTKEIGIRKVVGASLFALWKMLVKDFVVLVVLSSIIAIPVVWYVMNDWLQKYEYRTEISWWIFLGAGSGALIITLVTVSYQAIRSALMNPVKSLRSE